jgi:hypothetical protein
MVPLYSIQCKKEKKRKREKEKKRKRELILCTSII